jgi:hypothetical protein
MPSVPLYVHQLNDGISLLRSMTVDWIDRRALEEVLGVSKWTAWRILKKCGAEEGPGGALMCRRPDLIGRLEELRGNQRFSTEIHRRNRVEEYLDSIVKYASRRHKEIARGGAASIALMGTRFSSLPPGVQLTSSELKIEFHGTEDFLGKIGALVYALDNDYEAISEFIERGVTDSGRSSSA